MIKLMIIHFVVVFGLSSYVFAQDTTIKRKTDCTSTGFICEEQEASAENDARESALQKYDTEALIAASEQTNICKSQIKDNFEKKCNSTLYRNLHIEIDEIKASINEKTAMVTMTQKSITGTASESPDSLKQIVSRLEKLISEINEIQNSKLIPLEDELKSLDKSCELEFALVNQVCQPPEVQTIGDKTVILKTKIVGTSSTVDKTEVPDGVGQAGSVAAVAKVNADGASIDAPQVEAARQSAESGYTNTSRVGGAAYTTFSNTSNLAATTIAQATATIDSLRIISDQSGGSTECTQFGDGCEGSVSDTEPLGRDLPYSMGVPVDEPASGAAAKTTKGGNTGGGASADQVMADAQSGAYGPSGSGSGDTSTTGGAAAGGSAQGGIGGVMSGLSTLGGIFGKSGSSFGNDSSYGSNRSGARYNSNSGGNSNYALPTDNTYNSNRKMQGNNQQPVAPGQRAFGGNPSGGGYGMPSADSGGGSSLGGSSAKGGSNNNSKPSLLSRIFGKKDKTFLGKSMGGKGGGYGSSSGSGRSGAGSYDGGSNNKDLLLKADGKSFDPSKYAPSKAAEDRAYARATGRKIASHTSGNTDAAALWPNDISRDKRRNMFSKVSVVHKMNLDLNK